MAADSQVDSRKQWGVLAAIETDEPNLAPETPEYERQLDTFLHEARACDTADERKEREQVLADIDRHAQAWLALEMANSSTTRDKSNTDDKLQQHDATHSSLNSSLSLVERNALGRIYTFGSYALGVSGPAADVDTLLVGPRHVPRDAFFERFPAFLIAQAGPGVVTELTCRSTAYVPVISFLYRGVEIDLLYAQACTTHVHDDTVFNIDNDEVLAGMDDKSILSLNGVRATRRMLQLVPDHDTFRQTLRFVKVGETCATRACKRLVPFPPSTPQVMLLGCSSSPEA
jgi:poly(A) polymerase Pap1